MKTKTEKMSLERLISQGADLEVSEDEKYRKKGKRHIRKPKFSAHIKTRAGERKSK